MSTRNTRGGKNYKRKKTNRVIQKRDIKIDVDQGEGYYAHVDKIIGHNRIDVQLLNGNTTQAIIPGRMFKRIWIKVGNYIIINTDYEVVKIIFEGDPLYQYVKKQFNDIIVTKPNTINDDVKNDITNNTNNYYDTKPNNDSSFVFEAEL